MGGGGVEWGGDMVLDIILGMKNIFHSYLFTKYKLNE